MQFMEQKRTLWIIAAVGVFLLVVIGAALILYSPQAQTTTKPAIASIDSPEQPFADGWMVPPSSGTATNKLPAGIPAESQSDIKDPNAAVPSATGNPIASTNTPQSSDQSNSGNVPVHTADTMTVITGTTNVYGVNTNTAAGALQPDGTTTTIDLNTLKSVPTPATESRVNTTEPDTGNSKTTSKTAQAVKVTNSSAEPAKQKQATETVSLPAKKIAEKSVQKKSSTSTVHNPVPSYWVQAASFSIKHSADAARAVLDDNRIPSEVFTYKDAKGKIYYRVRVGPYTTKSEAEYWQNRIVQIKEFSETSSYITNSTAPLK